MRAVEPKSGEESKEQKVFQPFAFFPPTECLIYVLRGMVLLRK